MIPLLLVEVLRFLLLIRILRQAFEFFQKYECPVRRNLEPFAARFTDEVVVYPNQVIL
jgi:hypothetical protein